MSKSYFRPSDDGQTFPFLIPANAMAVVELNSLKRTMDILAEQRLGGDDGQQATALGTRALELAESIEAGIWQFAVNDDSILAYEVSLFRETSMLKL